MNPAAQQPPSSRAPGRVQPRWTPFCPAPREGKAPKSDVPLGEHRWLTVVSPDTPDGVELVLEPDEHPAAKPFKAALVEDGIPYTSFGVEDVQRAYERLRALGVRFTQEPSAMGPVVTAVLVLQP